MNIKITQERRASKDERKSGSAKWVVTDAIVREVIESSPIDSILIGGKDSVAEVIVVAKGGELRSRFELTDVATHGERRKSGASLADRALRGEFDKGVAEARQDL